MCVNLSANGTVIGSALAAVAIQPAYSNCTIAGVIETTASTKGCKHVLRADTDGKGHAAMDIVCEAGKSVVFAGPGCEVVVESANNQDLKGVSVTNTGAGETRHIDLKFTITGLNYYAAGFLCWLTGTPTGLQTNGTLRGDMTIYGESDPGTTHRGIWLDHREPRRAFLDKDTRIP